MWYVCRVGKKNPKPFMEKNLKDARSDFHLYIFFLSWDIPQLTQTYITGCGSFLSHSRKRALSLFVNNAGIFMNIR